MDKFIEILEILEKIVFELKEAIDELGVKTRPSRGLTIDEISFVGDSSDSELDFDI